MNDLYFSFFMFTADLRPDDRAYTETLVAHMRALVGMGYAGFDLPIAPTDPGTHAAALASYARLKHELDAAGLDKVGFTTNVAATRACDPSSEDAAVRNAALAYLKSRVDITAALGGRIMAGSDRLSLRRLSEDRLGRRPLERRAAGLGPAAQPSCAPGD